VTDASVSESPAVPRGLVRRVRAVAFLAAAATVGNTALVLAALGAEAALRWTAAAGLGLAYVLVLLVRNRDGNRPAEGGPVAATLGLPNAVSVARGVLVAWVAGFAALPAWPTGALAWAPALWYGTAAALDAVDGALARRYDRETGLGARLDVEYDAFGLLAGSVAGVVGGVVPWPYVAVGVARYAFVGGLAVRRRSGRPVYELPARTSRRVLAGLQMAFVAGALAPPAPAWAVRVGAAVFGGAVLLGFLRDWLSVTGRRRERGDRPTERDEGG
jgi:CDP-diacylglycerol--glycerol-3-phosphate 3-phosphatidyltransferase